MSAQQDLQERLRDAAFADNIPADWDMAVAGYLQSGSEFHAWSSQDWGRFPKNRKLPIWVAGHSAITEANNCLQQLRDLRVPAGVPIVADMETRVDRYWLEAFAATIVTVGKYKLWTYGSASTVFQNVSFHGYWVADYRGTGPFTYPHADVRATQYQTGMFDSSTVKDYTFDEMDWWV